MPDGSWLFITVRRKGDPVDDAYYGMDYIGIIKPVSGAYFANILYKYSSGALVSSNAGTSGGIYPFPYLYDTGVLTTQVQKRYNATYAPNWAGTYKVSIYTVVPPSPIVVPPLVIGE
jgi:hypothetical protein